MRAGEHPDEGEADDIERGDGDGERRNASAGARPDVGDGVVEEGVEGPEEDHNSAPSEPAPKIDGDAPVIDVMYSISSSSIWT